MDRAAAEREALRLWRNLPLQERLTREQAIAFSVMIAPTLEFDALDRRTRVIEGWLVRDILQTETAALLKEQQERTGEPPLPIMTACLPHSSVSAPLAPVRKGES